MIEQREIERVATLLGNAANASQIILFGSHARGEAEENSDVDLMIMGGGLGDVHWIIGLQAISWKKWGQKKWGQVYC